MADGVAEIEVPAQPNNDRLLQDIREMMFDWSEEVKSEYSSYCSCGRGSDDGRCGSRRGCCDEGYAAGPPYQINISCNGRDGTVRSPL